MEASKLSKINKITLAVLVVTLLIVVFFLGRNSKPDTIEVKPTDTSGLRKTIDSLIADKKWYKDSVTKEFININKLITKKSDNHKQTKNEVIKIKSSTTADLQRWSDSTLSTEGLK